MNTSILSQLQAHSVTPESIDTFFGKMGEVPYALKDIAFKGQHTVIYASPNTGKTLISLALLCRAIESEDIDPTKVFYVNADDNGKGIREKAAISKEYGFNMIIPNMNIAGVVGDDGRETVIGTEHLTDIMKALVAHKEANGVVIILDTFKKFADLMNKQGVSIFANIIRTFCMAGGTIISLAHTNKNRNSDGKSIYGGTSDLRDDADAVYVMDVHEDATNKERRTVRLTSDASEGGKSRGANVLEYFVSYSLSRITTYSELMQSLVVHGESIEETFKEETIIPEHADFIKTIKSKLSEEPRVSMFTRGEYKNLTLTSVRETDKLIQKYNGVHWKIETRNANAKHLINLD